MYLAGDIGGTNLRLAMYGEGNVVVKRHVYSTVDCVDLLAQIREFVADYKPLSGCFAIAGPVVQKNDIQIATLTNKEPFQNYHSNVFSAQLGFPCVFINDFMSIGHFICYAPQNSFYPFKQLENDAQKPSSASKLYLGAGTGLGVGFILNNQPFASEGGHTRFSVENQFEFDFYQFYCKSIGSQHLSNDRVISGQGIQKLIEFVADLTPALILSNLTEQFQQKFLPLQEVQIQMKQLIPSTTPELSSELIKQVGENSTKVQAMTLVMAIWFHWYGRVIADLAVTFCASEIYIAGGIIEKNLDLLKTVIGEFKKNAILRKGRLSNITENANIQIITEKDAGLLGCLYLMQAKQK